MLSPLWFHRIGNQSKTNEPMKPFKAPWECPKPITPGHTYSSVRHFKAVLASNKENPQKKLPLLWAPEPGVSKFSRSTKNSTNESLKSNSKVDSKNCLWSTRSHFRHLKHTPTFVDESLFGPKLEEPSFEAPWNDSSSINNIISNTNKEKRKQLSSTNPRKPYLWDPSGDSRIQTHNGLEINLGATERPKSSQRPKSAIGISRSDPRPHWKPWIMYMLIHMYWTLYSLVAWVLNKYLVSYKA